MSRSIIMAALSVLLLTVVNFPAHARHHHHYRHHSYRHLDAYNSPGGCVLTNNGRQVCGAGFQARAAVAAPAAVIDGNGSRVAYADSGTVIGARPAGCPHAYCGCGLRKYLGLSDTRLNLASNWARLFPHVSGPAPGVAAVRSGHVMYIEAAAGRGQWLVRDYNSGGGLSRLHVRDVRGYVFVSPHG
ncbi:MAG TPA: hypothetical protein VFA57_13915 [Pseudolabrys sp.]|nr:hypothetical protein [Pseudolabrys sp.]